jgi:hypothetical protein
MVHGAALLRESSFGRAPLFYARDDGLGWVVVKGAMYDTASESPNVDLDALLENLLAGETSELNRYEGAFALAAWDVRRQQGWAFNDQLSTLNLYYGVYEGGLYVSTNALSLARALGLGLSTDGVQEFLARNVLLAPSTLFDGLRRVNIGEHVSFRSGILSRSRHWYTYAPEASYKTLREAAEVAAGTAVDHIKRYTYSGDAVVCDLTGGLDSRVIASAVSAAGLKPTVTVNGLPGSEDVRIARRLADRMQWESLYFDNRLLRTVEITPDVRRELLYRTGGDFLFTAVYDQLLTRPQMSQAFDLHMLGLGPDLLRYQPWGQEFLGIGRRQEANVNNLLTYRFLNNVPPTSLFAQDWLPAFRSNLKARIEAVCREFSGTRTTQQLDAVFMWKGTGHGSLYMSASYNWLPSVAPLSSAGPVKLAVSMPWKMRLTSQLQRQVIYTLSPRAASELTAYGSTAEPISPKNLHLEAWQVAKRGAHLARKLDRVLLKGAFTGAGTGNMEARGQIPFVTEDFKTILDPESMLSRALYTPEGLRATLSGGDREWQARSSLILKVATIEAVCRELDFEPDGNFLSLSS